jgi:hypothetical protein
MDDAQRRAKDFNADERLARARERQRKQALTILKLIQEGKMRLLTEADIEALFSALDEGP